MAKTGTSTRKTSTGFEQHISHYKAQNGKGCPLRWGCHKAKGERVIDINLNMERHKLKARSKLLGQERG